MNEQGRNSRDWRGRRSRRRPVAVESLESRRLLAADGFSEILSADVSGDGHVTAADAIRIINRLGQSAAGRSPLDAEAVDALVDRFDVNHDGQISANDAVFVINRLTGEQSSRVVDRVLEQLETRWAEQRPGLLSFLRGRDTDSDSDQAPLGRELLSGLIERISAIRGELGLPADVVGDLLERVSGVLAEATPPSAESLLELRNAWQSAIEDRALTADEIEALRPAIAGVLESAGVDPQRAEPLLDRFEEVLNRLADSDDPAAGETLDDLILRFASVLESLPDDGVLFDGPRADAIREAARRLAGSLEDGSGLGVVTDVIRVLRSVDEPVNFPELGTVFVWWRTLRDAATDDQIDADEREQILAATDSLLASMGLSDETRQQLMGLIQQRLSV